MTSTVWITVPIATITVDDTAPSPTSPTTLASTSDQEFSNSIISSTLPFINTLTSERTASQSTLQILTLTDAPPESLPTVLLSTTQSPSATTAAVIGTPQSSSVDQPSESAASTPSQVPQHRKNAIIGGLIGAMVAALLIGVLICLYLRWRRLRNQNAVSSHFASEKGFSPMFFANQRPRTNENWDSPASYGERRAQEIPRDSAVTVDERHRIIRMSTVHWPRPYAPGEGYRDSVPPGTLRVVNPDRSLPPTPGDASDMTGRGRASSIASFLRRQKIATGDTSTGSTPRSRASSHSVTVWPMSSLDHTKAKDQRIPIITIEPALSQDSLPTRVETAASVPRGPHIRPAAAHIVDSRPLTSLSNKRDSFASSLIVQQRPPEDPFCTPLAAQSRSYDLEDTASGTVTAQSLNRPHQHNRVDSGRTENNVTTRPSATQVNYSYAFRPHDAQKSPALPVLQPEPSTANRNATDRYTSDSDILRSHMKFPTKRQTLDDQQQQQCWARRSDPFDLDRASMRYSDLFPLSAATADGRAPDRSAGRLSSPRDKEPRSRITSLSGVQVYEGT